MRTRTGKIARLPGAIRHELNHRLHNGALGRELVPWLNALPEVQRVLAERFASRPITEDNLSEWRQGGFQDWLLQEERRVRLRELSNQCPERDPALRARRLAAYTEEQLALELAEEIERLSAMKDRDARSKHLQRLCRELCRLQNSHTRNREVRLLETKATHSANVTGIARVSRAVGGVPPPASFDHIEPSYNHPTTTQLADAHAIKPKSNLNQTSFKLKSESIGPFRTNDPMGGSRSPAVPPM